MQAQRNQRWRVMRVVNVSTGEADEVGTVDAPDAETAQRLGGDIVGDFQTFRVELMEGSELPPTRTCCFHDCERPARYLVVNSEHDSFPFKDGAALVCTYDLQNVNWPHLWMPLVDFYERAERDSHGV